MNLIDAVKSGKRIRRKDKGSGRWIDINEYTGGCLTMGLYKEDILTDDWEVEEPNPKQRTYERRYGFLKESQGTIQLVFYDHVNYPPVFGSKLTRVEQFDCEVEV